jgi:predicted ATPase/DNA-binding SARP family transcriptional activator
MVITVDNANPLLQVGLLGRFTLQENGVDRDLPASTHARSLLAYLFLNPAKQHPRSVLAALLSPEASEEAARRTLNQSLWYIRRSLTGLLCSGPEQVCLSPGYTLVIDVVEFEKHLRPHPDEEQQPQAALRHLKAAVDLYRGDLLEGVYEDWVLAERERLRELFIQALERLSQALKGEQDYEQALVIAFRLTQVDPLRESAHREVMRLHHLLGNEGLALKQFEACRRLFKDELGLEPELETVELAREIARRSSNPEAPYLPEANPRSGESPLERNLPGQIPLIGRSLEKQALLGLLEPIFNRTGILIAIEGEPGIGKTRLINEAQRDLEWRGVQVVSGKASELETRTLKGTVIQALKTGLTPMRVEQIRSLASPAQLPVVEWIFAYLLSPGLSGSPPEISSTPDPRGAVRHGLAVMLSLWSQVTPLVIVLEDFHWAGEDAWEILGELAEILCQRQPMGVAFLVSLRPSEAQSRPFILAALKKLSADRLLNRIELQPLNPEATSQLVRGYLGIQQPLESIETRLYRETGGNPLFILESLRWWYEKSFLVRGEAGRWEISPAVDTVGLIRRPISPTIESLLAHRMEQLSPSSFQVLQTLAVAGDAFNFATLRAVFPQDPASLFADLRQLVQTHFLVETAQDYRFSHDTLRQAAYTSLTPDERIMLHRQVAQALEALHPEEVDTLAFHYHQGKLWERAVETYQKAGQAAVRSFNYHHAERAFSEAIHLARFAQLTPEQHFDLLMYREKVLSTLGERDRQAQDLQAMDRLIQDYQLGTGPRLQWLFRQANYLYYTCQYAPMEAVARQALALAEKCLDQIAMAHALDALGSALHGAGHANEAIPYLIQVIPLFHSNGDLPAESKAWRTLSVIHTDASRYGPALEAIQAATVLDRQIEKRIGLANDLWLTAWILLEQGDYEPAEAAVRESLEICRSFGDRYTQAMAESVMVDVLVAQGAIGPAFEMFEHAISLCRSLKEEKLQISLLCDYTSQILRFLGDPELAARTLQAAEKLASKQNLAPELAICAAGWARIEFQRGQYAEACRRQEIALASLLEQDLPREVIGLRLLQVEMELAAGSPQAALSGLEEAQSLSRNIQLGMVELDLLASRSAVLLALGRREEAVEAACQALRRIPKGLNSGYLIPYRYYQALDACGRLAEGQPALAQAVQMLNAVLDSLPPSQQKISRQQVLLHREILSTWENLQPHRVGVSLPGSEASSVPVTWTVWLLEDQAIQDKVERRRHQLERLLVEDGQQGGEPTHRHLAQALRVSERTIAHDLAALKRKSPKKIT